MDDAGSKGVERPESKERDTSFLVDGWVVDPMANQMSREGMTEQLEPRVMGVLAYLAARPGQIVRREELLARVWNVSYVGDEALSRCISVLRRVFRDDPRNPHVIETISKTGYRLMRADPQRQERSEEGDGVVHGRPSRGVRSVDLPSLFIGGWFRTSVTRYGAGPLSDVEWLELVSRAQALLGVAGDSRGSATSTRGRAWTFHSWWKVLVLTTIPITEGGAEQHLLRLQVRDAAVLGELVPAVVGLVSTALVGVGMGALGFAAPLAFGLALALAVTCGLSLLAIRRIRRRLVRRRQELYRLLEALAP